MPSGLFFQAKFSDMDNLFEQLPTIDKKLIAEFIENPEIGKLINLGAFSEVYSEFYKYVSNKGYSGDDMVSGLTALFLSAGVEIFGEHGRIIYMYSFAHLPIQYYKVPEGVERIANCAFIGCKQLRRIHLPKSIISIGTDVFTSCSWLETIQYDGTYEELENIKWPEYLFPTRTAVNLRTIICTNGVYNDKGEKIK